MHEVLQKYLTTLYNASIKEADEMNLEYYLVEAMKKNFLKIKSEIGKNPCTLAEMDEFKKQGIEILDYFKKNRADYFSKKGYELVGVEVPLNIELKNNIRFVGYIDIIIRDTLNDIIKIIDFKTSTTGWNDYAKKDESKISQVIMYKKFYSEYYKHPIDKIEVEFLILKRKLLENVNYPQKRIQKFSPPSGATSLKSITKLLNDFIDNCFTVEGDYNINKKYLKTEDIKKCKFCPFYETSYCDRKN